MQTGYSFEEFCKTPLDVYLTHKKEEENKFVWYMDYIKLENGGEYWGEHELGLNRYRALSSFQKLVFDRFDYKYQMIAKRGTDEDWLNFVEENLTWLKEH